MEKVIFLDIDGVLNNENTKPTVIVEHHDRVCGVEDALLDRLKKIVDVTNATIILSSDWRYGWYPDGEGNWLHAVYLDRQLAKKGLFIENKTPYYPTSCERGLEIYEWLKEHPETKEWVILEDSDWNSFYEYPQIMQHWVHTDWKKGLTEEDVIVAIDILNGNLLE